MAWLMLAGAILTEVTATSMLKLSGGGSRIVPTIVAGAGYILSFVLLAQALKMHMQVSIAYAVWSGVGTAAIALIGAFVLHEPLRSTKVLGVVLVILGVVVLNLAAPA